MDVPKGGIIGRAVHTARQVRRLRIPLHAAYTAYFLILSLFPSLLLVLAMLRYTGLQVQSLVELLSELLPDALMGAMEALVYSTYRASSGAVVGVAAVTALWSASRGMCGLLRGLNAVYGVEEDRGYVHTRLLSAAYTFAFFLVLLLTLVLHVFGSAVIGLLTMVDNRVLIFLVDLIDLRFVLLLVLQSLLFSLMFTVLPNRRNRFRDSLPGGTLASVGWLVFSDLFSVYVENFDRYANIFGSVYAIALSMLWLYCCMGILFFGGALNRLLLEWKGENVDEL